ARKHAEVRETADTEAILEMTSHSTYFLKRQIIYAVLGIIVLLVAYNIDYERYKKYASPALWITFVLLLLVYIPGIGITVKGARRWLNLGIMQLQVSELAKITMI